MSHRNARLAPAGRLILVQRVTAGRQSPTWRWKWASPGPPRTGGRTATGRRDRPNAWIAPGWRAARATDQDDPWAVLGASVVPEPGAVSGTAGHCLGTMPGMVGGLPTGVGLTGDGGLDIAGLEWLGARAYDPAARGFLSTDPLSAP